MPQQIQDQKRVIVESSFWIVVANNCTKSFELSTYSKHNTTSRLESSVISAFNNYWKLLKYVSHPARFGFRRGHHKRKKYVQTSFKNRHGCRCSSFDPDSRHGKTLSCSPSGTCGANKCNSWQGIKIRHCSTIVGLKTQELQIGANGHNCFSFLTRMDSGPHLTKSFCLDLKCFKHMMCKKRRKS